MENIIVYIKCMLQYWGLFLKQAKLLANVVGKNKHEHIQEIMSYAVLPVTKSEDFNLFIDSKIKKRQNNWKITVSEVG